MAELAKPEIAENDKDKANSRSFADMIWNRCCKGSAVVLAEGETTSVISRFLWRPPQYFAKAALAATKQLLSTEIKGNNSIVDSSIQTAFNSKVTAVKDATSESMNTESQSTLMPSNAPSVSKPEGTETSSSTLLDGPIQRSPCIIHLNENQLQFRWSRCLLSPALASDPSISAGYASLQVTLDKFERIQRDTEGESSHVDLISPLIPYLNISLNGQKIYRSPTLSITHGMHSYIDLPLDERFEICLYHPRSTMTLELLDMDDTEGISFGDDCFGRVDLPLHLMIPNRVYCLDIEFPDIPLSEEAFINSGGHPLRKPHRGRVSHHVAAARLTKSLRKAHASIDLIGSDASQNSSLRETLHQALQHEVRKAATHPAVAISSPQPTAAISSSQPTVAISSSQPTVAISSPQPTVAISSPQPTVAISSSQPTVAISSSQPTVAISSPQPTVAISSSQPTVAISSPQPTVSLSLEGSSTETATTWPSPSLPTPEAVGRDVEEEKNSSGDASAVEAVSVKHSAASSTLSHPSSHSSAPACWPSSSPISSFHLRIMLHMKQRSSVDEIAACTLPSTFFRSKYTSPVVHFSQLWNVITELQNTVRLLVDWTFLPCYNLLSWKYPVRSFVMLGGFWFFWFFPILSFSVILFFMGGAFLLLGNEQPAAPTSMEDSAALGSQEFYPSLQAKEGEKGKPSSNALRIEESPPDWGPLRSHPHETATSAIPSDSSPAIESFIKSIVTSAVTHSMAARIVEAHYYLNIIIFSCKFLMEKIKQRKLIMVGLCWLLSASILQYPHLFPRIMYWGCLITGSLFLTSGNRILGIPSRIALAILMYIRILYVRKRRQSSFALSH
ncbi:hypothetical protein IE077_002297 [Cardiosporidium cionae]|uniref:Uncharacterized protein n=1 Tax=Cardiosporidium cionae TaxID=476202 RepID=A0ABQ7JB65_9APIC|nr:hypothetical protein IE077_002297 [Cardiosporidium cionae]|eukprot:KAF8821229.1 hypothetical protein IE077_002297 [Cardiosporidium cionae]